MYHLVSGSTRSLATQCTIRGGGEIERETYIEIEKESDGKNERDREKEREIK